MLTHITEKMPTSVNWVSDRDFLNALEFLGSRHAADDSGVIGGSTVVLGLVIDTARYESAHTLIAQILKMGRIVSASEQSKYERLL